MAGSTLRAKLGLGWARAGWSPCEPDEAEPFRAVGASVIANAMIPDS